MDFRTAMGQHEEGRFRRRVFSGKTVGLLASRTLDCADSVMHDVSWMKKSKLDPSYYQCLVEDQYDLLRHAFESFLVWERFGDLIRDIRTGDVEYPRVHFFQPITLAFVASAFDSFVLNLYKFHDPHSNTLETLLDVGIRAGTIEPGSERILAKRITHVKALAADLNIRTLRNSTVGHYNATVEKRSPLTTVRPKPKKIRQYIKEVAEILSMCARRARFYQQPLRYDHNEHAILTLSGLLSGYITMGNERTLESKARGTR